MTPPESPEPPPLPDPSDHPGAYDPAPDPAYDPGPAASSSPPPPITQGAVGSAGVVAGGLRCHGCGYDLTGATIGGRCPECNAPITMQFQQGPTLPSSGFAIASLVLGICAVLGSCMYGLPGMICGILALIFHRKAKQQIDTGMRSRESRGLATAGFVCGLVGLILGGLYFVFLAVFFGIMMAGGGF